MLLKNALLVKFSGPESFIIEVKIWGYIFLISIALNPFMGLAGKDRTSPKTKAFLTWHLDSTPKFTPGVKLPGLESWTQVEMLGNECFHTLCVPTYPFWIKDFVISGYCLCYQLDSPCQTVYATSWTDQGVKDTNDEIECSICVPHNIKSSFSSACQLFMGTLVGLNSAERLVGKCLCSNVVTKSLDDAVFWLHTHTHNDD